MSIVFFLEESHRLLRTWQLETSVLDCGCIYDDNIMIKELLSKTSKFPWYKYRLLGLWDGTTITLKKKVSREDTNTWGGDFPGM